MDQNITNLVALASSFKTPATGPQNPGGVEKPQERGSSLSPKMGEGRTPVSVSPTPQRLKALPFLSKE